MCYALHTMKPYTPNLKDGGIRIMHTLRKGIEVEQMERLHKLVEAETGISLTRPQVLRIAVHRELMRQIPNSQEKA